MKLLNNFFEIKEKRAGGTCLSFLIKLNKDHAIYKAHFPQRPITPGVCIMQMVQEILETEHKFSLTLHKIIHVKFRQALQPCVIPSFSYQKVIRNNDTLKVIANVHDEEKEYACFSLVYYIRQDGNEIDCNLKDSSDQIISI